MSTQKRENFCLREAKLVFCIPCKSSRLRNQQYNVFIDEAANLKESDSSVSLTIGGIKHVVLVGEDNQLQSVVMGPICLFIRLNVASDYFLVISRLLIFSLNLQIAEEAKYARSLFERLCQIGYHKHLLNLQYKMHHSINFPVAKLYDGKLENRPNRNDLFVTLLGDMFFIIHSLMVKMVQNSILVGVKNI